MILDTNALSAWLDGDPAIEMTLARASCVALSVIAMGEYRFGVMFSRNRAEYEQRIAVVETDLPVKRQRKQLRRTGPRLGSANPSSTRGASCGVTSGHRRVDSRE